MKQVKSGKQGASFLNRDDPDAAWPELEETILEVLASPTPPAVTTPALPFASPLDSARGRIVAQPAAHDATPRLRAEATAEPPPKRGRLLRRLLGGD